MDLTRLRQRLGLSADSSEDEVVQAAEAALGEEQPEGDPAPAPTPADPTPGETAPGSEPSPPTDPAPADDPEQPGQPGAVVVDASVLASLRADAQAGRAAREEQLRDRDEAVLASAIRTGRIPPARREHYAAAMRADREGTTALLESLAPDLVPLEARGGNSDTVEEGGDQQAVGYPAHWLPDVAARKAEIAAGTGLPRITIT